MAVGAVAAAAVGASLTDAPGASAEDGQRIRPRSDWDFDGWAKQVDSVARGERTHFVVHWQGPKSNWFKDLFKEDEIKNGPGAPKQMHKLAKEDDGPGIEYSFVITQHGEIWEGRGFDLLAGAVEKFNTPSISVQIHIRKGETPSKNAMKALEWLYFESNRVLSRSKDGSQIKKALQITGHKDHFGTECPGPDLEDWVNNDGPRLEGEAQADFAAPPFEGGTTVEPYPGEQAFRIGKSDPAVVTLDKALIKKGYTKHNDGNGYQAGETFTESTRLNVRDFQLAQGWTGSGADGYPGPKTWDKLVN
ncbi:hypothetical protein VV02_22825 [Luteipulveratus mongoliensis]|uniref:Peptidoglycan binding-like domain-containing protein n=2 Tax=Luteipulveratus mongoliensis TaxID=571913 RepID=A0A0K1JN69_9MICO|nr:hypothetical protein VV02_22825 [Luteipulveratus mongoliensis]